MNKVIKLKEALPDGRSTIISKTCFKCKGGRCHKCGQKVSLKDLKGGIEYGNGVVIGHNSHKECK